MSAAPSPSPTGSTTATAFPARAPNSRCRTTPQTGAAKPGRSRRRPPCNCPRAQNGVGEARTTADLSEHPWAGARVMMTLSALSVSGKTGTSAPVEVTLPQRTFHNPLARALVEQRRDLILDPDHAPKRVETALTGLSVAPELFDTPANVYLGLKQARSSLAAARTDADLLDVAALLWTMAQQIEDGDASQAERDLRAAEKALREALKRGASEDEIKKLMQDLREAAKRFAGEMARKAERNGEQSPQESNEQAQDLDKLMDRMEEAARNGTREEAEAMLDQMQEMFENMRSADEDQESPAEQAMRKQMDELGKLLQDQQALRDDTFRSDQRDRERKRGKNAQCRRDRTNRRSPTTMRPSADRGPEPNRFQARRGRSQSRRTAARAAPARAARPPGRIAAHAEKLRPEEREGIRRRRKGYEGGRGRPQGRKGPRAATRALRGQNGQAGKGAAVDAQGRAIEALREGAQGMQKQMGQGQGSATASADIPRAACAPARGPATIRSGAGGRATSAATKDR